MTIAMASSEGGVLERPGGVFIRRADLAVGGRHRAAPNDGAHSRALRRRRPRRDRRGEHSELRERSPAVAVASPTAHVEVAARSESSRRPTRRRASANGYGGLTDAGDFAIDVAGERVPPAPWANVIANPSIGFCVTERGGGFTWAENSHFFRLTPWFNDPVSDPCGEVLYLRDADSGVVWTPTPGPSAAVGDRARARRDIASRTRRA